MTADGADLARRQLLDLVEVADGAVEVLKEWTNVHGNTAFTISLDTSGLAHTATGITVRDRERFKVVINDGFPFVPPSVGLPRVGLTRGVEWFRPRVRAG